MGGKWCERQPQREDGNRMAGHGNNLWSNRGWSAFEKRPVLLLTYCLSWPESSMG
jgi:hypothetical protein